MVISSRIASSATLALKSGEWFFRFVILDHLSHKLTHLNYRSEPSRPLLAAHVKAFVPTAHDFGALYLREDVEAVFKPFQILSRK
jgi:hypothetical protein